MENLSWVKYLAEMYDRFAPSEYEDPMADLVALKQTCTVDHFHDEFLSLLNFLDLWKPYALSIFINT